MISGLPAFSLEYFSKVKLTHTCAGIHEEADDHAEGNN